MQNQVKPKVLKEFTFNFIKNEGEEPKEFMIYATTRLEATKLMKENCIVKDWLSYEYKKTNTSLASKDRCKRLTEKYGSPEGVVQEEYRCIELFRQMKGD